MFGRSRRRSDFKEEVLSHIELETERLIGEGLTPEDARATAHRRFGNVAAAEERFYEFHRTMWLDDFCRDVRYSLRAMAKHPGFAVMAILALSLGIGANTAIFTLLDAVVLKPLALPATGELITLYEKGPEGVADATGGSGRFLRFSNPRFERLAAALGSHGTLAAATRSNAFVYQESQSAARTRVNGQLVSGGYFQTLQVLPQRGRLLDQNDIQNAVPVAVISDRFWRRALNSSAAAVGQTLVLNNLSVTIVGITVPQFVGMWTDSEADVWLPLTLQQAIEYHNNVSAYGPAELQNKPYLAWSFALLTLLLASLGIYGVLAYEVSRRTREIGVRMALGARRTEVTRIVLAEALGVTVAGLSVGLAGAAILARYLQGLLFELSATSFSAFAIVPVVFAVVAAAAAYLPTRRAMKVDPMVALRCE